MTLESLVNQAVIIDEVQEKRDTVELGLTVMVKNPHGRTSKYTITGSAQADPQEDNISDVSPIGKGPLGEKVKEVAEVNAAA